MTEDLIRSRGCEETILFKEVIVPCGTQIAWCHTRGECPMWRVACVCLPQLCGAVVKIVALWRSLREGYCVLRGSSDLDGCGQWLCRRQVAPGESLAALPEQLCTVQSFVTGTVFLTGFLITFSPSGRPCVFLRRRSWVSLTDGRPVRDLLADSFRGPVHGQLDD